MLAQLLRVTFDLLLLRRGPQDMPSDWGLLAGLGLAYCSLAFVQVRLVAPPMSAFVQAVLATALLAAYVHFILRMRGYPARFVQTLSALFASGTVLTLLLLGPTSALTPFLEAVANNQNPDSVPQPAGSVVLVYMAVGLWGVFVFGHIYRNALEVNLWLGIGAALAFELLLFLCFAVLGAGG